MREIRYIVVHHSASPLTTTASEVASWHAAKGWDGAGYHLIVESSGETILGRPIDKIGAHCRGDGNRYGIGICLVGDNTTMSNRWTRAQVRMLASTVHLLAILFPGAVVLGHRDMPGAATLCPGLDVRALLGLEPAILEA